MNAILTLGYKIDNYSEKDPLRIDFIKQQQGAVYNENK